MTPEQIAAAATAAVRCTRCRAQAGAPCKPVSTARVPVGDIPSWNDGPAQMSHGAHLPRIAAYARQRR